MELFQNGAKFYTCGSTRAASGIKAAIIKMFETFGTEGADGSKSAEEAWAKIQNERYAVDVFS